MPRFYFDVTVGNEPTVIDREGLDLVDADAAHNKVIETATALARYEPHPSRRPLTVIVAVRSDLIQRPIMRGTLILRVAQDEPAAA